MTNTMSISLKNEHFQTFNELIEKQNYLSNSLKINKTYIESKIFQKSIGSDKFPKPWFYNEPLYVDKFNDLITKFQNEIQHFNS